MARSPYLVVKRRSALNKKRFMYYIRLWKAESREYTVLKSARVLAEYLGIDTDEWPPNSKAGARYIAAKWLESGGDDTVKAWQNPAFQFTLPAQKKNEIVLIDYALTFWDWEKSDYIQGKIARGQHIGQHWVRDCYKRIETYIKPRIKSLLLKDITAKDLDNLQLQLKRETKLSPKTINSTMNALCTPIREAFRLGQIPHNPAQNFRSLPENTKRKGILTTAEMETLFSKDWESEQIRLAINVAYSAGLRLGEILALSADDIAEDFEHKPVLWVRKSWSAVEGLKGTKTGNVRVVPISAEIRDNLLKLGDDNPHKNGFIFWGPEADRPISPKTIEYGFYRHLAKMDIDNDERLRRNISFHSFRHAFNSALRGAIPDATLRLATGHADPDMTNHYDHLTDERLSEIRKAQEQKILQFKHEEKQARGA